MVGSSSISNATFQTVQLGSVKSDGTPDIANILFRLPVPHRRMSIRQAIKIDEADVPGRSGKIKQPVGYDDTEIKIDILLVDEDPQGESLVIRRPDGTWGVVRSAREQLEELQRAFRDRSEPVVRGSRSAASASRYVPTIFSIQSPLTDSCGIKTVLFQDLSVQDVEGATDLQVRISLIEFEPVATQVEKRRNETRQRVQAQEQAAAAAAENPEDGPLPGDESPLAAAFRQGKADAMGGWP